MTVCVSTENWSHRINVHRLTCTHCCTPRQPPSTTRRLDIITSHDIANDAMCRMCWRSAVRVGLPCLHPLCIVACRASGHVNVLSAAVRPVPDPGLCACATISFPLSLRSLLTTASVQRRACCDATKSASPLKGVVCLHCYSRAAVAALQPHSLTQQPCTVKPLQISRLRLRSLALSLAAREGTHPTVLSRQYLPLLDAGWEWVLRYMSFCVCDFLLQGPSSHIQMPLTFPTSRCMYMQGAPATVAFGGARTPYARPVAQPGFIGGAALPQAQQHGVPSFGVLGAGFASASAAVVGVRPYASPALLVPQAPAGYPPVAGHAAYVAPLVSHGASYSHIGSAPVHDPVAATAAAAEADRKMRALNAERRARMEAEAEDNELGEADDPVRALSRAFCARVRIAHVLALARAPRTDHRCSRDRPDIHT